MAGAYPGAIPDSDEFRFDKLMLGGLMGAGVGPSVGARFLRPGERFPVWGWRRRCPPTRNARVRAGNKGRVGETKRNAL